MNDLVSEESDEESRDCDDKDTSPARHVSVDSIEELGSNDDIDGGPTNTSEDVKDGDFIKVSKRSSEVVGSDC